MKNLLFIFLPLFLGLGCNNVDYAKDDDFSISIQTQIDLQAGLTPNLGVTHVHEVLGVFTQIDKYLAANGATRDQIKGIYPRKAELTSLYNTDLDFIRIIELYINSEENTGVKEAFYHPDIPNKTGSILQLYENNQVNFLIFFSEDKINVILESNHDDVTNNTTEVKLIMDFGVQLK